MVPLLWFALLVGCLCASMHSGRLYGLSDREVVNVNGAAITARCCAAYAFRALLCKARLTWLLGLLLWPPLVEIISAPDLFSGGTCPQPGV